MAKAPAPVPKSALDEAYIRKCFDAQTWEYVQKKPGCFNLLAVGEDGLGKTAFLETLFNLRVSGLRESKASVANSEHLTRDSPLQITTDRMTIKADTDEHGVRRGPTTICLMTTVNYAVTESCRNPWAFVSEYITKQVQNFVHSRAQNPLASSAEFDNRVHCCLYFLPPLGPKGLRRCDVQAIQALENKVNIIPVLAKADSYTPTELLQRKEAVAADIERCSLRVHQYLETKNSAMNQPLAVMGAPPPDCSRAYPWGTVEVEQRNNSDVAVLRTLIVEKNMLMMRKSTKRLNLQPTPSQPRR